MIVARPVARGHIRTSFYSTRNDCYTSLDEFFSFGIVSRDGLLFRPSPQERGIYGSGDGVGIN